jgi:heme exporter protein B
LLPVLIFPIIVPLVIAVVQATGLALGNELAQDRPWLGLLIAFDAVYLAIGVVLFEYILEE